MTPNQLVLSWKDHDGTLVSLFQNLLKNNSLVDCTLAADGQYLKAHKVVLSACSSYFELLFRQESEKNPIVILKDVEFQELEAAVNFMYRGEVEICEDRLAAFLAVAKSLKIKGLGYDRKTQRSKEKPSALSEKISSATSAVSPQHHSGNEALNSQRDSTDESTNVPAACEPVRIIENSAVHQSLHSENSRSSPNLRPAVNETGEGTQNDEDNFENSRSSLTALPQFSSGGNEQSHTKPAIKIELVTNLPGGVNSEIVDMDFVDELIKMEEQDSDEINVETDSEEPSTSQQDVGASWSREDSVQSVLSLGKDEPSTSSSQGRQETYNSTKSTAMSTASTGADIVQDLVEVIYFSPVNESNFAQTPKRQRLETEGEWRNKISKTILGQSLLASFKLKGTFDNSSRTKIAHIVICEEFASNCNTEITTTRFKELASALCEEFPGEDENVWYTPSITRDSKTSVPKGKLYDQYTSITKELRDSGLRSSRRGKIVSLASVSHRGRPQLPVCDLSESEIQKRLDFLKENVSDWDLIVDNWVKTIKVRQTDLRNQSNVDDKENTYTFNYINKYPALKQPLGHTLLEIDFKTLFPAAHGRIFSKWETFLEKLKRQLDIESVKHSAFSSDAEWLRAYANLFGSVPVKVVKGKTWKPFKSEILDGFLLHIKDINDLNMTLQYLTERNKAKGLSVQPFPLIVGKTLKSITQSYLVIDQKPLLVESPRHAVAYAFYSYHALHTNYPAHSARLWVVLERALFGVQDSSSEDIAAFPEVRRLITCLKV